MDWRQYESEICSRLRQLFPGTELELDAHLRGRISGADRQIDVLARGHMLDTRPFAVIDCKYFSRTVDITVVEAFLGFLADVGAHVGVLVTNVGYSAAAEKRASGDQTRDVRLHVVKVTELSSLPTYRFIYFGAAGVRVALPIGWDLNQGLERVPGAASWDILPKGLSRDAAYRLPLWGCLSIVPVPHGQGMVVARRLIAGRHQISERRGHVQYRAEENGAGDITYCRLQTKEGIVELSATLVAENFVTSVELQTRQECQEQDEQILVQIARNMLPVALRMPDGKAPDKDAWAEAVSRSPIPGSSQ